ncbi:hypothetical protein D3C83_137160 [compost metagenome]
MRNAPDQNATDRRAEDRPLSSFDVIAAAPTFAVRGRRRRESPKFLGRDYPVRLR